MKKTTLFFMFSLLALCSSVNAQSDYYTALPTNGGTSGNGRAPQALDRYDRSVWLISSAEMTAAGFVNGDVLNSIGFNYNTASDVAASGTFKVYLQNAASTVTANAKSTTWSTAITGMTVVSNNTIPIPAATGTVDFPFSGGTAFTYTGGALYVATDYQNVSGTVATVSNVAWCDNTLTGGLNGARSTTAAPTALTASAFRPETRFGKSVACSRPTNVAIPSTTLTTANLTFTSANPVNIEYGPYNFATGSGTTATDISSPYVISGLTPSTAYEVYTKSDCGAFTGLSAFTDPISFHTTFQPADPTYNTSFEIDDFPNIGWLADPETNGSDWFVIYGGTGSALVQNGLSSIGSIANATAAASAMVYSRGVNLVAGSTVTVTYYDRVYLSATAPSITSSTYKLSYGTTQTAATQTNTLATVTAANTAYALKTYTFTPATTGVYYFSFLNTTAANATASTTEALLIDNFTVSQTLSNNVVLDSKFSTFPNPAKNVINVANTTDALISGIEMTDINGRVVKNVKLSDVSEAQVNVSDLSVGVYMMKIVSDKGTTTKKVIKE